MTLANALESADGFELGSVNVHRLEAPRPVAALLPSLLLSCPPGLLVSFGSFAVNVKVNRDKSTVGLCGLLPRCLQNHVIVYACIYVCTYVWAYVCECQHVVIPFLIW